MNTNVSLALALCTMCLVLPAAAHGEEGGGWKMPNLNPFSRKGAPPTSARISDQDEGWKMPKLLPTSNSSRTAAKPKGQSAWQRMTTGTKTFMAKTADALNPFDDAQDQEPVRITGSKNTVRRASAKKEQKPSPWLPSLWGQGDEERGPKTVNDFLNQERLKP